MSVNDIIKAKPYLAWDVMDLEKLSEESVLEHVLNYGNWDDVREFIRIKGKDETRELFKNTLARKRSNYSKEIESYFNRYFNMNHV